MTTTIPWSRSISGLFVRSLVLGTLVLGALIVPLFAGSQRAFAAGSVSDNFNRANGPLGVGWTDMSDGGLAISSQVVVGTKTTYSGDIRTGETYASDQSSQIEVTSTQLSGGQWIGAAVRAQNGGQNLYLGLYFWDNGNPELMLYKRISGNWTQLGGSSFQGALAAGTQLNLSVTGSKLTFTQNGVTRITATDTSLTGGAPGIMAYGAPKGDNWVGVGTTGSTYTVGGTIAGLTGTAVLENNAGNDLSTSTNGAFTFSTPLAQGSAYNVTVKTNPSGQVCTVTNPSGTIATANVTNVSVTCVTQVVPTYTVGGTIAGLTGTAVLENNAGNDLSTSTNGAFTFSTPLAQGSAYNVTVKTNPSGQVCTVTNPSGTIATANVTNVSVTCVTQVVPTYTVGGTIAGLTGTAVLENNAGNDLSTSTNGAFTFSTPLAQGSAYNVTVKTNPSGQVCTVTNPSGTIATANVTNVSVTCVTQVVPTYTVGGTIAGLTGTAVLENNAGNDLSTSTNGAFTFSTPLAQGSAYNVTVKTNPSGQVCTVTNPSGTIATANVTNVSVTCVTQVVPTYTVGGTIAGLTGTAVLENNAGNDLSTSTNGAFTFSTPLAQGSAYNVTVKTNPSGQVCTVTNPSGTIATANVTNVSVTCVTQTGNGSVSDNFNRANGSLGVGWTDMSDGGLAISSQVVVGTKTTYSGDIRTGETYASDQSSQIEVTSTQLSGGQWIGAAVRAQNGGQNLYLGLYFWDNGNPELMLYKRISGNWTQLGGSSFQGALAAGTQLNLSVTGSKLTFTQNGVTRITATDTSLTGGAPGIMAYGAPKGDNWVGVGTTGSTYTVGGTIAGLTGTAVLENNAGNDLSTSTNGAFTFSTPLAQGSAYNVTVKTNPSGQVCTVTNPSGTIATANVTNVSVTCVTQVVPTYTVGGTIAGLTGTAVLENNAGNDLSTSTNGAFTFSTPLAQGSAYNVTVKTNPSGQVCTVTNPSGTIATANVTNVSVTCVTQTAGGLSVQYQSTDANNIEYFSYTSPTDGDGTQTLRVLVPTHPAAGVAHNFLYVLPVEPGVGSSFGDGMQTMLALDAEDQYDLTIIEPSFSIDPWYADNPNDANLQYETFMTSELVPWVQANLSTTGTEQNWLIGFSKSGIGGQDLILKHPDLFQLAASWDFPADMSAYDEYGSSSADNYGTDANFQANYRLTAAFLDAHKSPFLTNNRIWIGGYYAFQTDVSDYDALLTSEGILHTLGPMQPIAHRWDSGWVAAALAALYQDSIQLH